MKLNRRTLSKTLLGAFAARAIGRAQNPAPVVGNGWITDVGGIKVGHWKDTRRPTGCTVLLFENGAICGVDVRGGWPGTRLTDALDPVKGASNTIRVDAIALSGGSSYGLATATGVEQFVREQYIRKMGSRAKDRPWVPAVPAAIIYDIELGDWTITPGAEAGYKACEAAASGAVAEGNEGAGTGATIGKMFGMTQAMKSGLGTSSIRVGDTGVVVGAIASVNALGDVIDPRTGKIVAGARRKDGKGFLSEIDHLRQGHGLRRRNENTTIAVVATNARFNKTEMSKIAQMASAGMARAVNPVFTTDDGDTIFAVSTGGSDFAAEAGAVGAIAAEALSEAILRAVMNAEGLPGLPAWRDLS